MSTVVEGQGVITTWAPKLCNIKAVMDIIWSLGLFLLHTFWVQVGVIMEEKMETAMVY